MALNLGVPKGKGGLGTSWCKLAKRVIMVLSRTQGRRPSGHSFTWGQDFQAQARDRGETELVEKKVSTREKGPKKGWCWAERPAVSEPESKFVVCVVVVEGTLVCPNTTENTHHPAQVSQQQCYNND